jgi:hypothetical protein
VCDFLLFLGKLVIVLVCGIVSYLSFGGYIPEIKVIIRILLPDPVLEGPEETRGSGLPDPRVGNSVFRISSLRFRNFGSIIRRFCFKQSFKVIAYLVGLKQKFLFSRYFCLRPKISSQYFCTSSIIFALDSVKFTVLSYYFQPFLSVNLQRHQNCYFQHENHLRKHKAAYYCEIIFESRLCYIHLEDFFLHPCFNGGLK